MCEGGVCDETAAPCPDATYSHDCAGDCGGPDPDCVSDASGCPMFEFLTNEWRSGDTVQVRMPDAAAVCECPDGRRYFWLSDVPFHPMQVSVGAPWWILAGPRTSLNGGRVPRPCEDAVGPECVISTEDDPTGRAVFVITQDPAARAQNITIELATAESQCP